MYTVRVRASLQFFAAIVMMSLSWNFLWAQNENETVGFQSNHIFESGNFGEDIDVLNGGLHLTLPIGPKYQINDRLGYQLILHYNSKVWEYSDYSATQGNSIKLVNEGPMGVGFTLSFGRLLKDAHNTSESGYQRTWKWVSPDGNQHDVWFGQGGTSEPDVSIYPLKTVDGTYIRVNNGGCASQITVPCKTVSMPNGLVYTLSWRVDYAETTDQNLRADNLSFGGWYVTRIEDRSVGNPDPINGLYPNHVVITYDNRPKFEHVIKEITDSRGRVIKFTNCAFISSTTCDKDVTSASDRSAVATKEIELLAFSGLETIDSSSTAKYKFTYAYGTVKRFHPAPGGLTVDPAGPTTELKRLDYPEYIHRDESSETYSVYFGYGDNPDLYPELTCRTLPLPKDESKSCTDWAGTPPTYADGRATFRYAYEHYAYMPLYLSSGSAHVGLVQDGTPTREVAVKRVLEPTSSGLVTHTWSYVRDMVQGTTNPNKVTVTDAVGNDTVYHYVASYYPANQNPLFQVGIYPDDGLAPEWNDGLNYKVEYFRGSGSTRTLVRTENQQYEADTQLLNNQVQRTKENTRSNRSSTVFNDDGGTEHVTANSGWDSLGNWRTITESGFAVSGLRTTHNDFYKIDFSELGTTRMVYLTGLPRYTETHDGFRVLQRVDNQYDGWGRLKTTVERQVLPGSLGSPVSTSATKGDLKTVLRYDYDPGLPTALQPTDGLLTGRIVDKSISSLGDSAPADLCVDYEWAEGIYLKTKYFKNCASGNRLTWKSIDRLRDGNTGLIYETRDPSYVTLTNEIKTQYQYDALGRVTDIKPREPEYATEIDYVTLRETTVTRHPESSSDFVFSRYSYDDFGRLRCEQKRPADSGNYPYQTSRYDILDNPVFKSEWLVDGTVCDPQATIGTSIEYGNDPFGRPTKKTTADGKITTNTYHGEDTITTVEGVVGPGGVPASVTTTYFRDAWNRLIKVDSPSNGGVDADYAYDLRDNLIRVDLYTNPLVKQTRLFEYDGRNKLFQSINPESNSTVYSDYDGFGNARSFTSADGITMLQTYDDAGRLTSIKKMGSTILLVQNIYDVGINAKGKLSSSVAREDTGGVIVSKSLSYEGLNGRLSSLVETFSGIAPFTITYGYNSYGDVVTQTYPEGPAGKGGSLQVDYSYSNGIPTQVLDHGTSIVLASVAYNPAGAIKTLTTPEAVKSQIEFDNRNRPSRITIGQGTYNASTNLFSSRTDFQSGTYSYDGAGNIYAMERANGLKNLYRYDPANRLVEAYDQVGESTSNYTQYTQCFRYDDFGNILGKKDQVTTSTCSSIIPEDIILMIDTGTNRILNEHRASAIVNFFYDVKGNVIKDWEQRFRYDSRNRMVSVSRVSDVADMSSPSTELGRYDYDGDGNRAVKLDRQRELRTYYIRDLGGQVQSEFRRTELGAYQPEWGRHHVYLAGREVALRENRIPNPPGALSVTTTRNGSVSDVFVKWRKNSAEDAVTTYRVYRKTGSGTVLAGSTSTACADPNFVCYTDPALPSDTVFTYQVSGVSATGEGYGSDLTWLRAGDITSPYRPTCMTGSASDGQVALSWNASVSDDVLGYSVYRRLGTSGPGQYKKITEVPTSNTSYLDSGVTNNQVYSYLVRAIDQVGRESPDVINGGKTCGPTGIPCTTNANCSATEYLCQYVCGQTSNTIFSAMPKDFAPPGPPREISAFGDCAGQGTARLSWAANADTDGVAKYWVYRTPDFAPPGPKLSGTDAGGKPKLYYNDSGLSTTTSYYYSLKAEDGKTNVSVMSLQAGVQPRLSSGQLAAPPGQLVLKAKDGSVAVRFDKPANMTGISSFVIYRKPNAEPSCLAFQEVHELKQDEWPSGVSYVTYSDGSVQNGIAWDYVVASRDSTGHESALSKAGLSIPVARPLNYRECVEPAPPGAAGDEGAILCGSTSFYRTVMKWSPPPSKPYHPILADNADGTLGYLLGYHLKRYSSRINGNTDSSAAVESPFLYYSVSSSQPNWRNLHCSTTLKPYCRVDDRQSGYCSYWEACVSMGWCIMDSVIACNRGNGDADCVAGTYCFGTCSNSSTTRCQANQDCPTGGTCSAPGECRMTATYSYGPPCVQKADCPATASCRRYDETFGGTNVVGPIPTDPYLLDGPDLRDFYPFGVNFKECGMASAVYKVFAFGSWQTVVSEPTNFDPTQVGADSSAINARCTTAPAQCDVAAPACTESAEPPTISTQPTVASTGPGKIKVTWDRPADLTNVAGYYLYAKENNKELVVPLPSHSYMFNESLPYVTLAEDTLCINGGKPCYEFENVPKKGRLGGVQKYQFQVAAFGRDGNVGVASPLSNEIQAQDSATELGLKTVIWTANDANRDGPVAWGIPDPRGYDGIKLQWTGTANRVYRSEAPEQAPCVILQQGAGNPTDRPVCFDSTAFSPVYTTGQSGTNVRLFHDKNVVPGKVYYYQVVTFDGSTEGAHSEIVRGMAIKHETLPLSPPRHFKAWAPMVNVAGLGWTGAPGVYLRWCPNPVEEGVTGYRIYRSTTPGGPYSQIVDIDNPGGVTNCLMGSQRCEIRSTTCSGCTTPPCLCKSATCTTGTGGTCKIVDLNNIAFPYKNADPTTQTQRYYYVVTALRGTAEESAYSKENVALPNYYCDSCNPTTYELRYDPDNEGDIACDDEMSSLEMGDETTESVASFGRKVSRSPLNVDQIAPYRIIGSKDPSQGGAGGGAIPTAVSRWLFYHTDHLGSPRVITDISGNVVSTHHIMPFGEEKPIPGRVSSSPKLFTGHERDIESASSDNADGLDYMLARYYGSSLGRFESPDPGKDTDPEDPQSWNMYTYVRNNPVLLTDPDGRKVKFDYQTSTGKKNRRANRAAKKALKKAAKADPKLKALYKELKKSSNVFTVTNRQSGDLTNSARPLSMTDAKNGTGTGATIGFAPFDDTDPTTGGTRDPAVGLTHELLGHGVDIDRGTVDQNAPAGSQVSRAEIRAVRTENLLRPHTGDPIRTMYGRDPVPDPTGDPESVP